MARAPQIRLSLNEVEVDKLTRWADKGGYSLATKATHIVRNEIEAAEKSGEIPPPTNGDSEEGPDQDDYQALVELVTKLSQGKKLTTAAIDQAARAAQIDPQALSSQLEKLG